MPLLFGGGLRLQLEFRLTGGINEWCATACCLGVAALAHRIAAQTHGTVSLATLGAPALPR